MFKPKLPNFTEAELRIMQVLWSQGPSTVREVSDLLEGDTNLAYTTILSTLQTMEQKGFVDHESQGRAYRYYAQVELSDAQDRALGYVLNRFFSGSAESLLLTLMNQEDVDVQSIERMRELINSDGEEADDEDAGDRS